MRDWDQHIDQYGQLVQETGNDLDTPQRTGMFWGGLAVRSILGIAWPMLKITKTLRAPVEALAQLEHNESGNYMRSANPESRGHYPDMLTRDQQTGILATMLAAKGQAKGACKRLMWANLKRLWLTNNRTAWRVDREKNPELIGKSKPNFAGLSQLAMCFRILEWWWTYPLIMLLDSELIYGAIVYRYFKKEREPINFMLRCGVARTHYPTPTAWLACWLTDPMDMYLRLVRYMKRLPHKAPPLEEIWTLEVMTNIFIGSAEGE